MVTNRAIFTIMHRAERKMADGRVVVKEQELIFKWTDEDVSKLIRLRREKDNLFSGKRFASASGWEAVLKEMGLAGVVSPAQAAKKWENLKKTYKELRKPPTGSGTESGETTAGTRNRFSPMDEAIGGRPSIQRPCLVASAWGENHSVSHSVSPDSVPQDSDSDTPEPGNLSGTEEPGPPKRQRRDAILDLLEREEKRAEERDRRAEAREERLLNSPEKIVEKI